MSTPVEKIKEKLSIAEVIESYVKLDRAGSNLKGKCPFHNEKSPSFFVSPDRGTYYCFGCGAKGDIFSFVQAFEGLDFMGALKMLASRAGVELSYEKPEVKSERERMYKIMDEASLFYEQELTKHPKAKEYLKGRGLTDETIKEFRIGFAPNDWRTLYNYLKGKKYTDAEIEKVGLTKKAEQAEKGYYDRFRGRIMFPLNDSGGRVIAFSGRILEDDGKSAKYLNSPDTPLFNKASVLYGIDKAKLEIRKRNFTILVEGQMDLIMSHQAGFKNTVAGSGTALTDTLADKENTVNNLGVVKRISPNIIMVYDSDKAGINAAERSAQIALSLGMDVKIGSVPEGKDPAELILKDKELWKDVLKNAKHVIEFVLNHQIESVPDKRKLAKAINERVLPFIATLKSNMEKAHFVSMVKDRTGIAEEAIWQDLKKVEKDISSKFTQNKTNTQSVQQTTVENNSSIKKIFGILFWQEHQENGINVEVYKSKLKELLGKERYEELEKEAVALKNELIFEAEVVYSKSAKIAEDLDDILKHFEEDTLKAEFAQTMQRLGLAERSKDEKLALELLQKCQDLSKRIAGLKGKVK